MATHSSLFDIVNRVLMHSGYDPIPDADTFNNQDLLDRPQLQTILFVDDSNRKLVRRLSELFMQRGPFTFATLAGTRDYDLDPTVDIESVLFHSIRIVQPAGVEGDLRYMGWEQYRTQFRNAETDGVTPAQPLYWVDLLTAPAAEARENKVRLVPTPDDVYVVEYQAKLEAVALKTADQKIVWPPVYEDVLYTWGESMLKRQLKTDNIDAYAQAALESVKAWATAPLDRPMAVSFGRLWIDGPRRFDKRRWR